MKDKLLKIIKYYGINNQQRQFQEEVFELQEAITTKEIHNFWKDEYRDDLLEHITEEIADVMIMINQFRLYYDIPTENIKRIINYKVDRQLKRIDKENEL